jgi:hypothetical protein
VGSSTLTENAPHVVPVDPFQGFRREPEHSRAQFVRAIDRKLELQRDPAAKELRDTLDRLDPYDAR